MLLGTTMVGAVLGIFRDNWFKDPDILISPENLPKLKIAVYEEAIKTEHSKNIAKRKDIDKEEELNFNVENNSSCQQIQTSTPEKQTNLVTNNKTESNKKNVTKNTSGLININSASKEDFMALPYIGEVKAEGIIQLMNEMGVFTSIKDLEKVKGIGPKTLTKIEPHLKN